MRDAWRKSAIDRPPAPAEGANDPAIGANTPNARSRKMPPCLSSLKVNFRMFIVVPSLSQIMSYKRLYSSRRRA